MNPLFDALAKYNRREQTILLIGALAVAVYLLWVALVSPLQSKREQQVATNAATSATLGRVKVLAARIKYAQRQQSQQSGHAGKISQLIDSSLQANGLRMSGFQPGTHGEVRVRLDNVNYGATIQWLYDMEYQHGISIRDLSMTANNQPGQITANIRLRKH